MADTHISDRQTVRVSYSVLSGAKRRSESRIFSRLRAANGADALTELQRCLRREHPGCDIQIDSLDHVLTGAR